MEALTVSWTGNTGARSAMGFIAETGSGHIIPMDIGPNAEHPEEGGQDMAARPMELLLAGTGGCTSFDVMRMLKRGHYDIRSCSVRISAERSTQDPKVLTSVKLHFCIKGKVPEKAVEEAIALSHEKYCSASIMLGKTAKITTSFEVEQV